MGTTQRGRSSPALALTRPRDTSYGKNREINSLEKKKCIGQDMSNYIAVPLRIGPNATHTIYIRAQVSKSKSDSDSDDESDPDRTLFVTGLPLDTTEDNVRDICKALGDVVLDKYTYQGGRHGLISLVDGAAATRMLSKAKKFASKKDKQIVWEQYGPRGAEAYMAHHQSMFPEEHDLQKKADEYMELFAKREELDRQEAEAAADHIDEDGFRTVVYKHRKRMADVAPISETDLPKRKKRSLEKSDFYRFQLREQRKTEMSDLLKRYQDDKKKVEELKERKAFRPY